MDQQDKKILDIIQTDFPISSRPYREIGRRIELTESETLARIRALQEKGVIRRIGANFQSRKLGWHSTLCAASVPEGQLEEFVAEVNRHSGVTHNYLRNHSHNVWFTYIAPSEEYVSRALAEITARTGIEILNLPAERMFKIQVEFPMQDEEKDD
ncbi:MAG: AsnC family transcriptional regulator [Thermodesulfobacteriota bacterium]